MRAILAEDLARCNDCACRSVGLRPSLPTGTENEPLRPPVYGEISIKEGRVEQANFESYQMVRLADAPKIEVHLALTGGKKWGGIGEPGTAPIAPAVCNAILAATGKRVRALPIKNVDLRSA